MVYLALSEGMMCNLLMFWESVVGMFRCRAEHDYCESKQSRRHHTAETKIVYPVLGKKNHLPLEIQLQRSIGGAFAHDW